MNDTLRTKTAVVTGVSTGIGHAIAATLIGDGWQVFGSVRSSTDAERLSGEFGPALTPLIFDVQREDKVAAASFAVRAALAGRTLDGLVNNAGIALPNPLLVQTVAEFREQVEINLIGTFAVIRAFAPLLGVERDLVGRRGRIVNMSSAGGRIGLPFLGAYSASKHGVEGLSESLRRELQLFGVDVIVIGPGAVATPIWDKAEAGSLEHLSETEWARPYRGFLAHMVKGGRAGLEPAQIGQVILEALTANRPCARYAPVAGRLANWVLPTRLPSRLVDRLIGRQLGLSGKRGRA